MCRPAVSPEIYQNGMYGARMSYKCLRACARIGGLNAECIAQEGQMDGRSQGLEGRGLNLARLGRL